MYLRLLEPASDLELFREAYNWRAKPRKHSQPARMSFEEFSSENPTHVVIGAFEKELIAVFFLWEYEPGIYDAHFTSRRHVSRVPLIQASQQVIGLFFQNGARVITAWIVERNRALRSFVEELGFELVCQKEFSCCDSVTPCSSIPCDAHPARVFLQYGIKGKTP